MPSVAVPPLALPIGLPTLQMPGVLPPVHPAFPSHCPPMTGWSITASLSWLVSFQPP